MLLVIDMQRQFTDPTAGSNYYPEIEAIKGPIARLVAALRAEAAAAGTPPPLIWVYDVHDSPADLEFRKLPPHGLVGTPDPEPDPDLQPAPGEPVLHKRRFSAFFGTDLDLRLRARGVDTVVLVGNKTNVCVRATATDAMGYGYRVLVVREAVASNRPHLHAASLEDIDRYIGQVITLEEALSLFSRKADRP
ncbi:MAG: isochorismatase family cysteine hydrolase [Bacillota bacterium]